MRLVERAKIIARDLYARPQANIPQACQSRAKTKAAYRFFDNKGTQLEAILSSHYQATWKRMSAERVVLAVQDTTYLNYSLHPATENLGPIGSKIDKTIGLVVHDTMAFNVDGTPLGLLDVQCWARDPKKFGKKHQRYGLGIEEKESNKWLISYQKASEAGRNNPGTIVVSIGDRESDIYELFRMASDERDGAKLLVRATQSRVLAKEQCLLWSYLSKEGAKGTVDIIFPGNGNVCLEPPDWKSVSWRQN